MENMNYTGYRSRDIRRGDRVYVRVTLERKGVLEMTYLTVESMTDLVGELRYAMRGREGLATVYIRNHSRGWSMERPMRFYPDGRGPRMRRGLQSAGRAVTAPRQSGGIHGTYPETAAPRDLTEYI